MSSEVRDPTSPSPLCLASHRHRGRARSDLARPRAQPGCFPSALPFWQRPGSRSDRAPYDSGAHDYESSRQATTCHNDRSGTGASDARVTRARGARRAARRTHEDRTPRVSSRPRASIRGSRWSFASRSFPAGSVVGRRSQTLARGRHAADAGVRAARRRPSRPARRDARRDVHRDHALVRATLALHSTPGRRRRRRRRSDGTTRCDDRARFSCTSDDEPSTDPARRTSTTRRPAPSSSSRSPSPKP